MREICFGEYIQLYNVCFEEKHSYWSCAIMVCFCEHTRTALHCPRQNYKSTDKESYFNSSSIYHSLFFAHYIQLSFLYVQGSNSLFDLEVKIAKVSFYTIRHYFPTFKINTLTRSHGPRIGPRWRKYGIPRIWHNIMIQQNKRGGWK